MGKNLFHLAFPVNDLKDAKAFYVGGLGCKAGRVSDHSMIFNLQGHQIVAQITKEPLPPQKGIYPRHFGLVFAKKKDWTALAARARRKKLTFYQEPKIRFEKTPIEHRTFFLSDPSGNLLEFKHYTNAAAVFGKKNYKKVGDR